jgi:serine/threonine-protein kinase
MAARDVFGIVGTTQAGNFHVERVVAEGGFGVVYRAQHGGFRAPVALKCLKIPEAMDKQERSAFLEKFREEGELMFRLSAAIPEVCHPLHIDVLLLADGRFVPFIALEWLDGESLDGIITRRREQKQAPLGLHKLMKMMRPIAGALSRAHHFPGPSGAVSIIHRDLKPENIFVATIGGAETIKILDFGIAKAKRAASQAAGRMTGRLVAEDEISSFTPAYGAPEQWTPKTWGETGPWTDVWGLALSMVEALVGQPVIDGDSYEMRRSCLDEKRRPTPRAHGATIPVEVERVFEQALAVDPRRRFKEIDAFWTELELAMGLPPSLGTARDGRRELGQQVAEKEAPAALTSTGSRLARAELQKAPGPAIGSGTAEPGSLPRVAGDPPRRKMAGQMAAVVLPGQRHDAAPPASKARAPSSPIIGDPGPRSEHPSLLDGAVVGKAARAEPSGEFEFELPSGPAPASPVMTSAPEPVAPVAPAPPRAAPVRRPSMNLEMDLPTHDPGPAAAEPPPSPPSRSAAALVDAPRPPAVEADEFDLGAPAPAARPSSEVSSGVTAPPSSLQPRTLEVEARPVGSAVPRLEVRRRTVSLGERLRAPLGILLLALAVALSDIVYTKMTQSPLMLGPVRPFWIAAPLALFGVGFTLWGLMRDHDEE